MQSRWFWNKWHNSFRWIWYILIGVFFFSFVLLWFVYGTGIEGVIHWNKIQEQKVLESIIHTFHVGPFELSVPAENYVIREYFNGGNIEINTFVWISFTVVLFICITFLLTVFTTFERFWYFIGITLFIGFVVSLRLDVLSIFGQRNNTPAITILAIYTVVSFYFQSFNRAVSFEGRLIVFSFLTLATGIVIYFFSSVPYPALHLTVTGYTSALIITVLFILMIAQEIPAALVYMVSHGNTKNLRHFSIVTAIYIANVIIAALHELGVIQWSFVYINLYLLISISTILGLWGFKHRENLYAGIFPFAPYGAYFYVALASICFITLSIFLGQANDPAQQVVRDIIIFSHVGYGVMFFLYVFSNFILMMAQNLPVYKVLYKPNRMPYFTFRFAGLITTLGFVFYSGWHQYIYNGIAAFYNDIGDLYVLLDKSATAEAYYEQGGRYGFANNHANYALGKLQVSRYNLDAALENYGLANNRRPTSFSIVNEGNVYLWKDKVRESIDALKLGLPRINGKGEIFNNLGYDYGKIRNLDSAVTYLNKARQFKHSKSSAEANFMAIATLEYLPINYDSVLKIFDNPYTPTLANAVAMATLQQKDFKTKTDVLSRRDLDLSSATLLNNYIIKNVKTADTVFINKAYRIAADSVNSDYSEALKAAVAFAYYHKGNVTKALQILGELAYISQGYQGKYNYIMGLWALEQHNPALASSYFKYAVNADYKEGKLYYAIALTENHQRTEATVAWDSVLSGKDEAAREIALQIKKVLNTNDVLSLGDAEKYMYCRYRVKLGDTVLFNHIVHSFANEDYRAQALLDMTNRLIEAGQLDKAIHYFNQVEGLKLTDKNLFEAVQHTELLMLAERKELHTLAAQINKGIEFDSQHYLEKIYFTALLNEVANDSIHAKSNFEIVGNYNPYFEPGVIAAADYFRIHSEDKMKAYRILVEAVQVNNTSIKLLKAYAGEALRMGFTDYAFSAMQQVEDLKRAVY